MAEGSINQYKKQNEDKEVVQGRKKSIHSPVELVLLLKVTTQRWLSDTVVYAMDKHLRLLCIFMIAW